MALTLSPMLGSKFLRKEPKQNFLVRNFDKFFKSFSKFYQETLIFWLNKKKTIISFMILIIIGSGVFYLQ